jgi:DNA-binding LacI/PurR family transcriptional regulator
MVDQVDGPIKPGSRAPEHLALTDSIAAMPPLSPTEEARKPTIKDVAARAGVSKSLVSRVLHDSPLVSTARRAAVLRAIEELGYRPNAAARTLVRRRSSTIAVLVTDLHNLFLPEAMSGLDAILEPTGYTTLIVSGRRRPEGEEAALHRLLELRVDGIVCASAHLGREALLEAARSTAVVSLTRTPTLPRVDSVVNDDCAGATLAVEHLAALGHRRIAMVGDSSERAGADRIRGYRQAMARLGLGRETAVVAGGFTERGGQEAGRSLLAIPQRRPTAIFVASDLAALGVLDAAAEAGLEVPGDLSVIGYDNTPFAGLRRIELSSVDQAATEIGGAAARALLARIEHPQRRARHVIVPPTLVLRHTTAPPAT